MTTHVFIKFDVRGKKSWWWAPNGDFGDEDEHGPFENRAEAEDAARAAMITSEAAKRHVD